MRARCKLCQTLYAILIDPIEHAISGDEVAGLWLKILASGCRVVDYWETLLTTQRVVGEGAVNGGHGNEFSTSVMRNVLYLRDTWV